MKTLLALTFLLLPCLANAASSTKCAADALVRARALLEFHLGESEGVNVSDKVKALPPLRNPKSPKQMFDVLEVWGFFYKGEYRMHLIYAQLPGDTCALVGEEILEFAKL